MDAEGSRAQHSQGQSILLGFFHYTDRFADKIELFWHRLRFPDSQKYRFLMNLILHLNVILSEAKNLGFE
jgi:hypothetical protein